MKTTLLTLSLGSLLFLSACGDPPETKSNSAEALAKANNLQTHLASAEDMLADLGCAFEQIPYSSASSTRKHDFKLTCSSSLASLTTNENALDVIQYKYDVLDEYSQVANVLRQSKSAPYKVRVDATLKSDLLEKEMSELKGLIQQLIKGEAIEISAQRIETLRQDVLDSKCKSGGSGLTCENLSLEPALIRFDKISDYQRALRMGVINASATDGQRKTWKGQEVDIHVLYDSELKLLRSQLKDISSEDLKKMLESSSQKLSLLQALREIDMGKKVDALSVTLKKNEEEAQGALSGIGGVSKPGPLKELREKYGL